MPKSLSAFQPKPDFLPNSNTKDLLDWKVFFEGNFWNHHGRDHAGKEIVINQSFLWGDSHWRIPSIYLCGKGLVVDFCACVPVQRIRTFMEKWNLSAETDCYTSFNHEQQMKLEAENPLCFNINPRASVNGTQLSSSHGCGICWNPCVPEDFIQEPETLAALRHYSLNPADGWIIHRHYFCWTTRRRPEIQSIVITLRQNRIPVPGPHFSVTSPGDHFQFVHPATGTPHTLTVQEYKPHKMPKKYLPPTLDYEFPTSCMAMRYTITPDLPDPAFTIRDCAESDSPIPKQKPPSSEPAGHAAAIAIIGGADGPTSFLLGSKNQKDLKTAYSSLHFAPEKKVEWIITFHKKALEDLEIKLL